jgi:uncharacterized protein (DUF342 family)
MKESGLKEFIKEGVQLKVFIQEALPIKGKPSQKSPGSKTVYIVKISLGEKEVILESTRGGPREWASLDKLSKWLKKYGIINYTIRHADTHNLLQQSLTFNSIK